MSYCRWSSDDYQCDLYVWEDCDGGWRSEVAGRRWIFDVPLPDPVSFNADNIPAWVARNRIVSDLLDDETKGRWLDLPEPDGGRSYWHGTPGECADNLERLRGLGLNVPRYAIDSLREDAAS